MEGGVESGVYNLARFQGDYLTAHCSAQDEGNQDSAADIIQS